jgi:hypothetical protein
MQESSPLGELCGLIFMNPVFYFVGSYLAMFVLCIGLAGPYLYYTNASFP